jgi:hypothetical protein
MSTKSTEGKIMQIRVQPDVYRLLLKTRAKVEEETGRVASFNDAIKYIYGENHD